MHFIETPAPPAWHADLDTIGVALFLRYRKRLLEPGIAFEIKCDYPDLPLLDLIFRVYAGRRLLRRGDGLRALRAIHSGGWPTMPGRHGPGVSRTTRGDPVSDWLVNLGGVLFVGFCILSLCS